MKKKKPEYNSLFIAVVAAMLALIFACSCGSSSQESTDKFIVTCHRDDCSSYPDLIRDILPSSTVDEYRTMGYYALENGAMEAFDVQAIPALQNNVARYWYPQYLATVVIAIDRDQTDVPLTKWRDLVLIKDQISLGVVDSNQRMLVAGLSYGLEGSDYTTQDAIDLLIRLASSNQLQYASQDTPIMICFDYQAVHLMKQGRHLDIIIPQEGTLTFTKGLLSRRQLSFSNDVEERLLAAGFKLPTGEADSNYYPREEIYVKAVNAENAQHFNTVAVDILRDLRRRVQKVRLFSSADPREHQLFPLLYLTLLTIWAASLVHRTVHKSSRGALLLTVVAVAGWVIMRLIKYQVPVYATKINGLLWYSYYLFQLALPLGLLWLAWSIDKTEDQIFPPKWFAVLCGINFSLFLIVLTNFRHQLIFMFDPMDSRWGHNYSYGPLYSLVLLATIIPFLAALIILLVKSKRNPRKRAILFPLGLCLILGLYSYGYITRVPIAWDSDATMMIGIISMLFIESAIRSGLVPVNKNYLKLFWQSTLGIQLIDSDNHVVLASSHATAISDDTITEIIQGDSKPYYLNDDTLVFAEPIIGGHVVWQEDISQLNRLQLKVEASIANLTVANTMLAEEARIKQAIYEEESQQALWAQIEEEIDDYVKEMRTRTVELLKSTVTKESLALLALLMCYIKRRFNLYFRTKETDRFALGEFILYFDELVELASYSGLHIFVTSEQEGEILPLQSSLLYDFFYVIVSWAAEQEASPLLVTLEKKDAQFIFRFLMPRVSQTFNVPPILADAVADIDGKIIFKELEEAWGISLLLPEEVSHG